MSGKALAAGADRMHNPRLAPCGSLNNTSLSPGRAEYDLVPSGSMPILTDGEPIRELLSIAEFDISDYSRFAIRRLNVKRLAVEGPTYV